MSNVLVDSRPNIALMMIVKNEAKTLPTLIESIKFIISSWVIIDTGSTDDTEKVIAEMLSDIPGELLRKPWVNFGHNRSELMKHFPADCEYALLLDADHIVAIEKSAITNDGKIQLSIPPGDAFMIQVDDNDLVYRMPYFVRKRDDLFYEGATHEFLNSREPIRRVNYDEIRIKHTAEGGSRSDKFERDRKMLTEEIVTKPSARNYFYLGQTYAALNQVNEAIIAYEECISRTNWSEEKYLALLRVGRLLQSKGEEEKALIKFLLAHEAFDGRAEASIEAARIFTSYGLRNRALEILREGEKRCPQGGILLIEKWVCQWGLETELGSTLWWLGDKSAAKEIFERVKKRPDLPESAIALLDKNLSFC